MITRTVGRRTIIQRYQSIVDAKEYIEREFGIPVENVDTIQDIEEALGLAWNADSCPHASVFLSRDGCDDPDSQRDTRDGPPVPAVMQ